MSGRAAIAVAEDFAREAPGDNRAGELFHMAATRLDGDWYIRAVLAGVLALAGALIAARPRWRKFVIRLGELMLVALVIVACGFRLQSSDRQVDILIALQNQNPQLIATAARCRLLADLVLALRSLPATADLGDERLVGPVPRRSPPRSGWRWPCVVAGARETSRGCRRAHRSPRLRRGDGDPPVARRVRPGLAGARRPRAASCGNTPIPSGAGWSRASDGSTSVSASRSSSSSPTRSPARRVSMKDLRGQGRRGRFLGHLVRPVRGARSPR